MDFFEEISAIPRATYHEEAIAEYLCDFARKRELEYYTDELHNVLIKKSGSKGRENEPALLFQGHTDMVCEKNEGVEHDFLTDGIELIETDDGWLKANNTTLGADNGVAVAVMLYVLDGADGRLESNPPIECLFTVSEEVGMEGAYGFDYSKISARRMINMDSADESLIIAGCSGGERTTLSFTPSKQKPCGTPLKISIKGLAGGHSGEDIHRDRANANKLMGRVLLSLAQKFDFSLSSMNGGSKDNAIPREAIAVITTERCEEAVKEIELLAEKIPPELSPDDSGFILSAEECAMPELVFDKESTEKITFLLATIPNGIFAMNHNIAGLVEFSRNVGVVHTDNESGRIEFLFSSRSPKPSQLVASVEQINAYAKMLGMDVKNGMAYPGWVYAEKSQIRDAYSEVYDEICGKKPEITAIHAGLECGVIKQNIPDMDIISCGPIVIDLHSPDEALNIASFERFFSIIKKLLERQ